MRYRDNKEYSVVKSLILVLRIIYWNFTYGQVRSILCDLRAGEDIGLFIKSSINDALVKSYEIAEDG